MCRMIGARLAWPVSVQPRKCGAAAVRSHRARSPTKERRTLFPPANECIYCGAKDVVLTREHIIPYSLGGTYVLPKASCAVHSALTSDLERQVARVAYGVYRAQTGAPTRHPDKLNEVLNKRVKIEGETFTGEKVEVEIAVSDVPPVPVFARLLLPDVLSGRPLDDKKSFTTECLPVGSSLRELRVRLGLKQLRSPISSFPITIFQRMLAKIGHSYAYATLGPTGFEPFLLPLILGEEVSAWQYVGGFEPEIVQGHQPLVLRIEKLGLDTLAVVEISLHFFPHMPRYQVVCGRLV